MDGDAVIKLDNLTAPIKGALFCSAITEDPVNIRVLGYSEKVSVDNTAVMTATGNCEITDGDMVRRSLVCELDAEEETPASREFKNKTDLRVCAREHRSEMIWSVLVLLRAYEQAIQENPANRVAVKPMGSFNEWSRRVREPLIYHGYADPLEAQSETNTVSPENERLRGMIRGLKVVADWARRKRGDADKAGNYWFTAKDVCVFDEVNEDELSSEGEVAARGLLEEAFGGSMGNVKSIGRLISAEKNRIMDGYRIEKIELPHRNSGYVVKKMQVR